MKENIAGRVARMNLRNALYPLFEAVSNSIDAIDAMHADPASGRIKIELFRETVQHQLDYDSDRIEPIRAIRVTDNGIGFTNENYTAFDEADTEYKLEIGGKGVGRFTWLKVFENTTIESTYDVGQERRRRSFTFSLPDGITDHLDEILKPAPSREAETSITMMLPKPPYQEELRVRAATIAASLVRHFLSYLIADKVPVIDVLDGDLNIPVTAADITARGRTQFELRGQDFIIDHIRVRSPEKPQHTAHYCARVLDQKE